MLERVQKTIEEYHMLEHGDSVVLGVSGGADSVCLYTVLRELAESMRLKLYVVHVNHMLREEAVIEEAYVKELCEDSQIPCFVFRKDIAAYAEELNCSLEEAGRNYRYACFEQVRREQGCDRIAVAHHQNDRTETMLFHMARGTGLRGLNGIPAVRDHVIRPLLACSRQEIEQYLNERKIHFYNDSSNESLEYTRNVIRHQVIPHLEKVNAKAISHMAMLADTAQEYWEYVEEQAKQVQQECVHRVGECIEWRQEDLERYPLVIRRHVIYRVLSEAAGVARDWEQFHVEQILDLQNKSVGKQIQLPYHLLAIRSYEGIRIQNNKAETNQWNCVKININGITEIPLMGQVKCHVSDWTGESDISKKLYTKMLDYDKINDTLCIRNPKPGDYFIVNSEGARKKVSRLFIDAKVPKEQREKQWVLAAGEQVYWIIGMRISEAVKIDETTRRVLRVTVQYFEESEGDYNG